MATTPPPPTRIRTPPTPLHGPKHDNYEPYSPRRSSRVAAQRKSLSEQQQQQQQKHAQSSSPKLRRARATTPTVVHRGAARTSNQTFSPPSSPASPALGTPGSRRKAKTSAESSHHLDVPHIDPRSMLPTPSKTPRKRAPQTQASLSSTARVLFPGRTASIEDAMPEPRKARRSKNAFSLGSFEMDAADGGGGGDDAIPIYTDSKERVPRLDDDNEDNPFVARKDVKGRASPRTTRKVRKDEKTLRMERAMRNDEGVIVTFRGRKIFRKFDDTDTNHATAASNSQSPSKHAAADEEEDDTWSDLEIRRKAGAAASTKQQQRPSFPRTAYKPRLLFPTEEQRRAREEHASTVADEADEEALTDIEVPIPQQASAAAATPVRRSVRAVTPPSTVRKTRGGGGGGGSGGRGKKLFEESSSSAVAAAMETSPAGVEVVAAGEDEVMVPDDQVSVTSSKKNSPFDTWRRTKAGSSSKQAGRKREASDAPETEGLAAKRTRGVAS